MSNNTGLIGTTRVLNNWGTVGTNLRHRAGPPLSCSSVCPAFPCSLGFSGTTMPRNRCSLDQATPMAGAGRRLEREDGRCQGIFPFCPLCFGQYPVHSGNGHISSTAWMPTSSALQGARESHDASPWLHLLTQSPVLCLALEW